MREWQSVECVRCPMGHLYLHSTSPRLQRLMGRINLQSTSSLLSHLLHGRPRHANGVEWGRGGSVCVCACVCQPRRGVCQMRCL